MTEKHGIALISLLGLLIFLSGSFYGLPQQWDADEIIFVQAAGTMLENRSLDPGWYGAPASTLIAGLAALYALIGGFGLVFGLFENPQEFAAHYYNDITVFLASGRILVAVFSVATLLPLLHILRTIKLSTPARLFVLALFIGCPVIIRYSSMVRMDMLQTLFNLASLYFCIRYLDSKQPLKHMILSGVFLGFAVASKYPGVVGAVPIAWVAFQRFMKNDIPAKQALAQLSAAGAASIATVFIVSPFLFLNFSVVLAHVTNEARPVHLSATSTGFLDAVLFYVTDILPRNVGRVATVLGTIGIFAMLADRKAAILSIFFLTYLGFISALNLQWERWFIPAVPIFIIGIAYCLDYLAAKLPVAGKTGASKLIMPAMMLVAIVPAISVSVPQVLARAQNLDTRAQATNWVKETFAPGSRLLLESYTPSLSSKEYAVVVADEGQLVLWSSIAENIRPPSFYGSMVRRWGSTDYETFLKHVREQNIEAVLLSNWHLRFDREAERYPGNKAFYDALFANLQIAKRFVPKEGLLGPQITVLVPKSEE